MSERPLRVFVGSSSEGKSIAHHLQVRLEGGDVDVEVTCWDQDVFPPSSYALDALTAAIERSDFAVLVASGDDVVNKRGEEKKSARDNVLLEFGLAAGILGRRRAFLLSPGDIDLPSDLKGLMWVPYRSRDDGNTSAALTPAALQIQGELRRHGPRSLETSEGQVRDDIQSLLAEELDLLQQNAESQGWQYRQTRTALRLRGPRGQRLTLELETPEKTRLHLRGFATQLKGHGLRVAGPLRRAPERTPLNG